MSKRTNSQPSSALNDQIKIIDPELLLTNTNDAGEMINFFSNQSKEGIKVWKKDTIYTINGTNFKFQHDVVERKSKKYAPEVRYEFISDTVLGKGSFGEVFRVAGTLAIKNGCIHFKKAGEHKDKTRVVKIQYHKETPTSFSDKEYNLSKNVAHLAYKQPTIQNDTSYSVMRELKGTTLEEILGGNPDLTLDERMELTVALLRALKEQTVDCGIIHRDIKPENIIVDMEQRPIKVSILDYGLSRLTKSPDNMYCGTPLYMAPEIWSKDTQTSKVDIFSMGRVIAQVWGINESTFGNTRGMAELIAKQVLNLEDLKDLNDLFDKVNINEPDKKVITTLLQGMLDPNVRTRLSIGQCLAQSPKWLECARLKELLCDYKTHLKKKLVKEGVHIESKEVLSSMQKKLLTRYSAIERAYEDIKNKTTLDDKDKIRAQEAVQCCLKNKPTWSERRFLQQLTDVLSIFSKILYRSIFSKEAKFQKKIDEIASVAQPNHRLHYGKS